MYYRLFFSFLIDLRLKYACCIFLFICSVNAFSQKGYKVIYENKHEYVSAISINGHRETIKDDKLYQLVFNDSFAYNYITGYNKKLMREVILPGNNKYFHHSNFFVRASKKLFKGNAFPDKKNPSFILDKVASKPVQIDSVITNYKTWRCREAYTVLNPGDTVFALLAIDYPFPYGPAGFFYFPFLPLEIYYPKTNFHFVIKEMSEGIYNLVFPADIPVFSRMEWNKKLLKSKD